MSLFCLEKIAIALVLSCALPGLEAQGAFKEALTYAGCDGEAGEYRFTFKASVVLNRRFLDSSRPESLSVEEAIRQQLRYLAGYFHNQQNPRHRVKAVFNESGMVFEVLKRSEVSYPFELTIDRIAHPDVTVDQPYIASALKGGGTSRADRALLVHYKATVKAMICSGAGKRIASSLKFSMPADPFLFYWNVPPESRRPIRWRKSIFTVNPCADAEVADLPDPFAFWYFWNPLKEDADDAKAEYSCPKLLREGQDYFNHEGMLTAVARPRVQKGIFALEALARKRALTATVVFGIIDPKARVLPSGELAGKLALDRVGYAQKISRVLAELGFPAAETPDPALDRGSSYFASFLRGLPVLLTVEHYVAKDLDGAMQLIIHARMKRSKRHLTMKIFFGPTDVLTQPPPKHWSTLADGLASDDMVFYNGHSGLGANTSLESLAGALREDLPRLKKRLLGPRYQLVAYLSCFTYAYFGEDLVRARAASGAKQAIDIVYTGTDFTSERGPLGLLDFIDRSVAKARFGARDLVSKDYLWNRDFIIVKNYR